MQINGCNIENSAYAQYCRHQRYKKSNTVTNLCVADEVLKQVAQNSVSLYVSGGTQVHASHLLLKKLF